jgi:hypothetical protein
MAQINLYDNSSEEPEPPRDALLRALGRWTAEPCEESKPPWDALLRAPGRSSETQIALARLRTYNILNILDYELIALQMESTM